jgi:hypothetical protein
MPNDPEVPGEAEGVPGGSRPPKTDPDEQLKALRERVAFLKGQARLLLERFQRGEASAIEIRMEGERLGGETSEAERRVEQWQAHCGRKSKH